MRIMVDIYKITEFLDKYLGVQNFEDIDIVVNGLEIEGSQEIEKAIFAVSLTERVVDTCIEENCNAIFLHHGILLRGGRGSEIILKTIRGSFRRILKKILQNDINIIAYHLPLDAHPEIGNNITIAKILNLTNVEWIPEKRGPPIGIVGELESEKDREEILKIVKERINEKSILLPHGPEKVKKIAIVSGAGSEYVYRFRRGEIDLLLTGEVKESCEVYAINEGINIIVAGHYHTEILGMKNLSKLVKDRFNINTKIVEIEQYI